MKIIKDPFVLQKELATKKQTHSIGFIPTMGGLHQGHFSLIEKAKSENDLCVVSIFLNPTQFNNPNDLSTYPSSLEQDIEELKERDVDFLFTPNFESIYPDNYRFEMIEKEFSHELCGQNRPGHFNGVLTVVLKLLNIVNPHKAYFGEKDFQQLKLIQDMVSALFLPIQIISAPIVRDDHGLALSSRNQRLSPEGISRAQFFAKTLKSGKDLKEISTQLSQHNIEIDYLEEMDNRRFAAVTIEDVRLIDNVQI